MLSGRLPTGVEVLTFFQHDKGIDVANHVTKGRILYSDWFSGEPTNGTGEELEANLKADFETFTENGSVIYMDKEKIESAERYIATIRGLNN